MKINIFVVSLLTLVKTLAVTYGLFFLLLLVFNDTLEFRSNGEDIFLYIFLGLFFYTMGCTAYVFSILLPMYFIDKPNYTVMGAHERIQHHAPIITLFLVVFVGLAALIAGTEGNAEGLVLANFFNVFVMCFCGLIFFEYQVQSALEKNQKAMQSHPQP